MEFDDFGLYGSTPSSIWSSAQQSQYSWLNYLCFNRFMEIVLRVLSFFSRKEGERERGSSTSNSISNFIWNKNHTSLSGMELQANQRHHETFQLWICFVLNHFFIDACELCCIVLSNFTREAVLFCFCVTFQHVLGARGWKSVSFTVLFSHL